MTTHSRESGDRPEDEPKTPTWTPSVRAGERRFSFGRVPYPASREPRVLFISWIPILVTDRTIPPPAWDFYIGQTVLREVQKRFIAQGEEALGLLLGKVHDAASGGTSPYVLIDQFLPALEAIPEDAEVEQAVRVLRPLQEAASLAGKTVAGWYRGHSRLGLAISEAERHFHAHRFPASWQFALIGVGDPDRPRGAFFARNGEGDLVPATFHELLEPDSILGGGRKRTMLEWSNYGTTDRVVAADGREIPRPPETLFAQPGESSRPPEEPETRPAQKPSVVRVRPPASEPAARASADRIESPVSEPAPAEPTKSASRAAPEPAARVRPAASEPLSAEPPVAEPSPVVGVEEAGVGSRREGAPVFGMREMDALPEADVAPTVERRKEETGLATRADVPGWIEARPGGSGPELVPLVLPGPPEERPAFSSSWRARFGVLPWVVGALLFLFALAWCG